MLNNKIDGNFTNSSLGFTNDDSLMNRIEIKVFLSVIMVFLCLMTTIGNVMVIYKYKKTYTVSNYKSNFFY